MKTLRLFSVLTFLIFGFLPAMALSDDRPHSGYTTVTKTATTTTNISDSTLWSPDSGKRFVLQGVLVSATEAVIVELEVNDVDVVPPIYIPSPGSQTVHSGGYPIYTGATNAVLTWTVQDLTSGSVSIMAWGYEDNF